MGISVHAKGQEEQPGASPHDLDFVGSFHTNFADR
jgi:hypothetical protein